jgi:hypothetical protein
LQASNVLSRRNILLTSVIAAAGAVAAVPLHSGRPAARIAARLEEAICGMQRRSRRGEPLGGAGSGGVGRGACPGAWPRRWPAFEFAGMEILDSPG